MKALSTYINEGFYKNVGHDDGIRIINIVKHMRDISKKYLSGELSRRQAENALEGLIQIIPVWYGIQVLWTDIPSLNFVIYKHNEGNDSSDRNFYIDNDTMRGGRLYMKDVRDEFCWLLLTQHSESFEIKACTWHEVRGKRVVELLEDLNESFYKNVGDSQWEKNCHEIMHMLISNQYNSQICPDELIEHSKIFFDEKEMWIELRYKYNGSSRRVRFDLCEKENAEKLSQYNLVDRIDLIQTFSAPSKKTGLEELVSLDVEFRVDGHIKTICLKPTKEL